MLFKRTMGAHILSYFIIIIFFSVATYVLGQDYPIKYVAFINSGLLLALIIYSVIRKSYYEIVDGKVRIYRGKKFKEISISKILHVRINTLERAGHRRHNSYVVIHDTAYLVLSDSKIKISTMPRNKDKKNLIDVLEKKYYKKIKYDE